MASDGVLTPLDSKVLQFIARRGVLDSERQMAKELRLNHSTLNYVLRKFEKQRIILGYKYRLDNRQVNLKQIAWVFISLKLNNLNVDEFIAKLFRLPTVRLVSIVTGDYDLAFKVFARGTEDIVQHIIRLEQEFHHWISGSSIFFVNRSFKQHALPVQELGKPTKLSKLDVQLLKERLADTEVSLNDLAQRLKVHRNTVGARWKKLLTDKVVVKKTAVINPEYYADAGVAFHAQMFVDAFPGKQEELGKKLAELPMVHEVDLISAPYDLLATVKVKDVQEYYEFLNLFYTRPEFNKLITRIKSSIILHGKPRPGAYFYELDGLLQEQP